MVHALSVANALGYPNEGPGGNSQGLAMWCHGKEDATLLVHSDQYRGIKTSLNGMNREPGENAYLEPNPDYYELINYGNGGVVPVGYGHRSVEFIVKSCAELSRINDLKKRQKIIRQFDEEGIMATPANSSYNELVVEAGRKSILAGGREVSIDYSSNPPVVDFKKY